MAKHDNPTQQPHNRELILGSVRRAYGSLETPHFAFVDKMLKSRPYRMFVDELLRHFFLRDVTDTNDDVSFVYEISDGKAIRWRLQLSMVGPYAFMQEVVRGDDVQPVHSLLTRHGLQLLDPQILMSPIDIKLPNTEDGQVFLYQALFSDVAPPSLWGQSGSA